VLGLLGLLFYLTRPPAESPSHTPQNLLSKTDGTKDQESPLAEKNGTTTTANPTEQNSTANAPKQPGEKTGATLPPDEQAPNSQPGKSTLEGENSVTSAPSSPGRIEIVADDGNTLWSSPTNGQPLQFAELPSNAAIYFSLRPWDLLNNSRVGPKLLAAAGPLAEQARQRLEQDLGLKFEQITLLQIVWVEDQNSLVPVYYARARDSVTPEQWKSQLGTLSEDPIGNIPVYRGKTGLLYYWPPQDRGKRLIAAAPRQMQELLTAPALPAPKMERLIKASDDQRLVNLLCAPSALFANGPRLIPSQAQLFKTLEQALGYDTEALSLSLHLIGPDFFTELKFRPSSGQVPAQAAKLYRDKLKAWEGGMNEFINTILPKNPQPFAFSLLMKLPRRIGKFVEYTRTGEEQGLVLVRTYLNADAGEHLVLGGELALAYAGMAAGGEQTSGTSSAADTTLAAPAGNTVAEKLQKKMSLAFARDTLEKSMEMLATEIGVPIEILGGDLQLEGITKNQSFSLEEKDKTAEQILLAIFAKANPDGKLVYIIKPKEPGGADMIFITTRGAAEKRKDQLPQIFGGGGKKSTNPAAKS
jgi:hypothetical protein